MRTFVNTDPNDPDEGDEWPGAVANVQHDGEVWIVDESDEIIETYNHDEWQSVTITNEEST